VLVNSHVDKDLLYKIQKGEGKAGKKKKASEGAVLTN